MVRVNARQVQTHTSRKLSGRIERLNYALHGDVNEIAIEHYGVAKTRTR
jgi:hypothetical protein